MLTSAKTTTVLDTLEARGFVAQISDRAGLERRLTLEPITAYCGYDATAPSLHVGNLVSVMVLAHLERAGNRPIVVMGGGTTMIGDPSGKTSERKLLSVDEIQENLASIRTQFGRYLNFDEDTALMVDNADWLLPLRYIEFLRDVGRHFTLNQLMQHETYRTRYETSSLSFIELNYAMIQAYDFLHLFREYGCVLQVGGNDQWFNILAGTELIRRSADGEAFVLTTPLITTASGQKMGKSEGNSIWLNPEMTSPYDYYQYWRNTEDPDVGRFLKMFTFLPLEEIAELETLEGAEINRAKEVLAFEATKITHGEEEARKAQETARARFRGEGADLGPRVSLAPETRLTDALVAADLAASRSDAKRLLRGRGVRVDGDVQTEDGALGDFPGPEHKLRVGNKIAHVDVRPA